MAELDPRDAKLAGLSHPMAETVTVSRTMAEISRFRDRTVEFSRPMAECAVRGR